MIHSGNFVKSITFCKKYEPISIVNKILTDKFKDLNLFYG